MTYILKFLEISKRYRKQKVPALDNVSFNIEEKSIIALLGPNGAGKTTVCKIISTVLYPDQGRVIFNGKDVFKNRKSYLKRIGVMFGNRIKLLQNIPLMESFYLMCSIYGIDKNRCRKRIEKISEVLGVDKLFMRRPREFSLGERTKSELVATLLHTPDLLILDEPTVGVDVISRKALYDVIKEYVKNDGGTVFITSHNTEDIRELADRILLINEGKIIFEGTYREFIRTFGSSNVKITVDFSNVQEYKEAMKVLKDKSDIQTDGLSVKMVVDRNRITDVLKHIVTLKGIHFTVEEEPLEEIIRRSFLKR